MAKVSQKELSFEFVVEAINKFLSEKLRRIFLAALVKGYGYGGIDAISKASGASHTTIRKGLKELETPDTIDVSVIRSKGGGRHSCKQQYPDLCEQLEKLIQDEAYGDPMTPLFYTTNSLRDLELALNKLGYKVSYKTVGRLLEGLGYSKQGNKKDLQVGEPHPDRDEQFKYIISKTKDFLGSNQPVISIDCKKKENLGNFKNEGTEYCKQGQARKVLDHDFLIKELGKVAPYGVYVLNNNTGFVNLGTDHDTAEFAGESIWSWWKIIGENTFSDIDKIYITCDGGGSNGWRTKAWKVAVQDFANRTNLEVHVSHYPPGTSKWNKIEHRLFCYISKNREGKPLVDIETVVQLIGSTTTKNGLTVKCVVDYDYPLGIHFDDSDMEKLNIEKDEILGDWNYIIRPKKR